MIRLFGSENRMPGAPAVSNSEPIDAACPTTSVETFRCDFMQRGGNVMVNSAEHEFSFLAAEQGETYIRINSIPLRFTRTGEYTLEVTQSPWLR